MSNPNQEIIESRLATFIDGELDAGERLEIEQHLQQNPQYRKVLDDLRKQRDMLRGLPREAAPQDLAEVFTNQLERAVLLDQDGADEKRLRIYAFPRMVAAAAIVLLTIGLAAIVYFVLPDRNSHSMAVMTPGPKAPADQIRSTPDTTPALPDDQTVDGDSDRNQIDRAKDTGDARVSIAEKRALAIAPAPAPELAAKPAEGLGAKDAARNEAANNLAIHNRNRSDFNLTASRDADLDRLAKAVSNDPRVKDLLVAASDKKRDIAEKESAPQDARVLVVRSNDPKQVESELLKFFSRDKIDWQPASPQVELALNTSLSRETTDALQNSDPVNRREISLESVETDRKLSEEQNQSRLAKAVSPQPSPAPAPAPAPVAQERGMPIAAQAGSKPGSDLGGGGNAAHATLDAAKGSVADAANGVPPATMGRSKALLKDITPQLRAEISSERRQGIVPNASPVETMFIVRRMSRRQADELNVCLAQNGEVSNSDSYRRLGEYRYAGNAAEEAKSAAVVSASQNSPAQNSPGSVPMPTSTRPPGSPSRLVDGLAPNSAKSGLANQPAEQPRTADKQFGSGTGGHGLNRTAEDDRFKAVVHKGDDLRLRYAGKDSHGQAETVKVKEDGTIAAKGKSVQVAGKTLAEVQHALSEFVSDPAGPTTQPAVSVERLAAEDEMVRAKPGEPAAGFRKLESTTQPAVPAPFAFDSPERHAAFSATTPLQGAQARMDLEDRDNAMVDVVIVVQRQSGLADTISAPPRAPILASPISPAASPVPATAPAAITVPKPTTRPAPGKK